MVQTTVNRTLTMTSNNAESIDAALKAARELPVLPLLDYIRKLIRRWNVKNLKNAVESFTDLGKKYDTMLMDNLELSHQMKCPPTQSKGFQFNVAFMPTPLLKYCCRRFQLDELPCAHAWAILKHKYIDHIEYCSVYYTTKYLLKTYEIPIYPVPDESTWEIPAEVLNEKVLPPDVTKTIGMPRKSRCKPKSERKRKRSISCGQSGKEGHNRKTCRNNPKRG
ncbi:PREDICTED: uncharacterized protein LOC109231452 [Nicotiana attenuata]|uniref:uncharacterized protein LOC109231452 n=1 Tax=Nicotiana attenuata TaxID=49451 RepID=UPI0009047F6A|nr:PREDICTED: uncharacterized protein LOC109231452 [Nicotiana attenuata]